MNIRNLCFPVFPIDDRIFQAYTSTHVSLSIICHFKLKVYLYYDFRCFSSLTLHLTQLHRKSVIWFNGHHHEIQIQNCRNLCECVCVCVRKFECLCEFSRVNLYTNKESFLCIEKPQWWDSFVIFSWERWHSTRIFNKKSRTNTHDLLIKKLAKQNWRKKV